VGGAVEGCGLGRVWAEEQGTVSPPRDWIEVFAGMPQGSFLGPLTFIILIDCVRAGGAACLTHKFVDDTTVTEILDKTAISQMQQTVDELVKQSANSRMNVNGTKTKEMLIGPIAKHPPPQLSLDGAAVDRVTTFKLLGVHVANDLKWTEHVKAISSKVASRLYFLKQLKRSGAPLSDLRCFYTTVVRPVLEYACPVWHSSLTDAQSDALESLQKRAMSIIYSSSNYVGNITIAGIDTLQSRREKLSRKFFKRNVLDDKALLHYLLPQPRDSDLIKKFRTAKPYERLQARTDKYRKSFIPYSITHYQ
jgi:Reverse transcriptase (RNA-dependent DNA polymerase)